MNDADVIVIGAGAAGGIVACVLAERGKRVILLERGKKYAIEEVARDHLRNYRTAIYGHNMGPELVGHPRVTTDGRVVMPHEDGYQNNAMAVGGGTPVYGAQAWRFLPDDFRMASRYGVPAGSSLADWPIGYEELEPWYERAEDEIGVCGVAHAGCGARKRDYPMPPQGDTLARAALRRGAEKLGWETRPPPLAVNSVARHGRAACDRCGTCIGFACHVDAKNGTQNTVIPRALATGRCELVTEALAARIVTDGRGRAIGVEYFVDTGGAPERRRATARAVVVCGGAIESARLLLMSASAEQPRRLGNDHDQVGRHLQGHYYPSAGALFAEVVRDGLGPGPSIATCRFNHGNDGIIGGGAVVDDFVRTPIGFWKRALPPGTQLWGQANKAFMRETLRHLSLSGPVQEIPSAEGRVMLDGAVRDKFGLPVVRFSGTQHAETVRTALFMRDRCVEWLAAAGAKRIWTGAVGLTLSGGQHQAGTCRMGTDPRTSVTDVWGRVHGMENVFVGDGGVHVTNGGFNPVLTIMALAFRNAEHVAGSL